MTDPFAPPLVASTVITAVNRLWDIASNGRGNLSDVNNNLRSLDIAVQRVQERVDQVGPRYTNVESWKPFVRDLTNLCYNIEDMIDTVKLAEMRHHCRKRRRNFLNRLLRPWPVGVLAYDEPLLSEAHKIILLNLTRWGLPRRINDCLQNLEKMEQAVKMWLDTSPGSSRGQSDDDVREVLHVATEPLPLPPGRQVDKSNVVNKLLTADVNGVSVVGMTGLGKTTLARSILDDARIREHFHVVLWGSAAGGLSNFKTVEFRRAKVHDGELKQCLVVVDDLQDVSTSNVVAWEDVFRSIHLRLQSSRSTLLITTRDPRVAWLTNTTPYYLRLMSDRDCDMVIRSRVYPALGSDIDRNFFEHNASHIAKMCMGLPQVARVIAHALHAQLCRHTKASDAISYFTRSDFWELEGKEILQSLRFKISGLRARPSKLLAYFSLFPCGHILRKDGLFQLWMAENFIKPEKWTNWEETADHHFHDILSASMIEPNSTNNSQNQDLTSYQVVEITRMFAQSIACNMCFSINKGDTNLPPRDTRHISVSCQDIEDNLLLHIGRSFQELRTFLFLHKDGAAIQGVPRCLFQKLLVLRVLDLSRSCLKIVPDSIGNLKHLRYLDLSHTIIRKLPNSTCNLLALRILKLIGCSQLQYLPKKFSNLLNLVHLDLTLTALSSNPPKIGKLINLQTLHKFTVNRNKGHRISELKHMNALRGSLKVMQLENVKDKTEAANAKLFAKSRLTSLELQWTESSMLQLQADATEILNELQPPQNLVELQVTNYYGLHYPWWFNNSPSIQNLEIIHLHNWPCCIKLPPFWRLPVLRTLRLDSMYGLTNVDSQFLRGDQGHEINRFPSLECLELRNMLNLVTWDELVVGDMPCLKNLKIVSCQKLTRMSSLHLLTSLKSLEISNCPWLQENPHIPLDCEFYFDRSM